MENPSDLAQIIGATIASISTLLGVLVANWLNSRTQNQAHALSVNQRKRETRLAKSEELYLALFRWQKDVNSLYLFHLRYIMNKLTFDQVNELVNNHFKENAHKFDVLTMLVDVHFPELKPDLELVLNMRTSLAKYLDKSAPQKFTADEVSKDLDRFDALCDYLLTKLASLVRQL